MSAPTHEQPPFTSTPTSDQYLTYTPEKEEMTNHLQRGLEHLRQVADFLESAD